MLVGLLKIIFPQVLEQRLGMLRQESVDLTQPCSRPHPAQVAVKALAEAGEH